MINNNVNSPRNGIAPRNNGDMEKEEVKMKKSVSKSKKYIKTNGVLSVRNSAVNCIKQ